MPSPLVIHNSGNIVPLYLPASRKDSLNWEEVKKEASSLIEKGKSIFWLLDLGLGREKISLHSEATFSALLIALEAFCEEIWQPFKEDTVALSLYQGGIDFSQKVLVDETEFIHWNKENLHGNRELFAAYKMGEYLSFLISHLPEEVRLINLFDCSGITSPTYIAQLIFQGRFGSMERALKKSPVFLDNLIWEEGEGIGWIGKGAPPAFKKLSSSALCLPEVIEKQMIPIMDQFIAKNRVRIIPESLLIEMWEGVDTLFVLPNSLSLAGERKVQGFIATEGKVVFL